MGVRGNTLVKLLKMTMQKDDDRKQTIRVRDKSGRTATRYDEIKEE